MAYVGADDAVAGAEDYWGLRAVNATKASAGVNALQICTASDLLCTNIRVTSSGGLNGSDITTSGCASTCTVKTLYAQLAVLPNFVQATEASRPVFVQNCISTLPCMTFNGSQNMAFAATYTRAQPFSIYGGVYATSGHAGFATYIGAGSTWDGFTNSANQIGGFAGTGLITVTANDDVWHGVGSVFNTSSSFAIADGGAATTGNMGTGASSGAVLSLGGGLAAWTGKMFEVGIYPSALTSTNLNAISANQHTYGIW